MIVHRNERDSLGSVKVPADALYGSQTQRAVDSFPVSGLRMPRSFIAAMAHVKSACAEANAELSPGRMTAEQCAAIQEACLEVGEGRLDSEFPVDVFQTGSGTSSNMNVNEVLANLANRRWGGLTGGYTPVHPINHVNMSQSSNDVVPTAVHLSALLALKHDLDPALGVLRGKLQDKAADFDEVVKLGRTHLMDAVPVRLGQEFGGYAMQVRKGGEQVSRAAQGMTELAIGGTATGTGLNAHPEFGKRVCEILERELGIPVLEARDHFEAQGGRDDMVMVSGALKGLACTLMKIANDIRLMGSGPFGGLAEISIPGLQPGSSIMPGKVNPVMCEMLTQVAAQVIGNDLAITIGGQGGQFELNAMVPMMANNLLQSITLLSNGCRLFAVQCVDGLVADTARCRSLIEMSPLGATILTPMIGYDRVAGLIRESLARKVAVNQLAVEQGLLTPEQAGKIFNPDRMTRPDGFSDVPDPAARPQ